MKNITSGATLLAFFLFFALAACSQPAPTSTPISPPPTAAPETAVEPTATDEPPTPEPAEPTPTNTAEPTAVSTEAPTTEPTAVPTEPAEPVSYTISVDSPQPDQIITVAREFTFSGTVDPVPSQRLELLLTANDPSGNGESMLAFADVDPNSGAWQITEQIHPRRTGPAALYVRAAGTDVSVPVTLQLARDETATIVTVNQPLSGDTAVAGRTLLISGESRNLIDDQIQVGLFGCPADTDENLEAEIAFEAGDGPWRAQIILPETAAVNCDTARLRVTTGGLTSSDPQVAWASDQFLTLVTPTDERANIFTIWEPSQLRFTPGQNTPLSGTAINPVDGQISVALVQNGAVIASVEAVPDGFGYWETSLTPPANTEPGEIELRLSTGAGDAYREMVLPTRLGA